MYAYKDLLELAGLTTRLYALLSTLHHLPALPPFEPLPDDIQVRDVDIGVPSHGEVEEINLIRNLEFEIKPGEHIMVTGPNGVGKTSIARVLSGLWAAKKGQIARPEEGVKGVFVVPQRPYMVVGTLRDQIIYPHTYEQFKAARKSDADLSEILLAAHLAYLPDREGGLGAIKEWKDVLSGGEKQRMNMARVFYHQPKFAVLDECTSAVSSDVEGLMYERAKGLGITLITISHRPSLAKYHRRLLTVTGDGVGGWKMAVVGTAEERMGIDREIATLEKRLAEVGTWESRVRELEQLLRI